MNKESKIDKLKPTIIRVLKKNGVKKAGIFGSYARNEETKFSDIDIVIQTKSGTGLFKFVGIRQELEEKLGIKVDLLTYNSIHPYIKENILNDEVRIL